MSHPPNITSLHFCTNLVVSPLSSHMNLYLNLHMSTKMILQMILSCVIPFQTLQLLWTRIKPSIELVFHNQHDFSFMKSMTGSLSVNIEKMMIPFCLSPLHSFLTSLVNLPSIVSHAYLHPRIHPLFIIYSKTPYLSPSYDNERIYYSLKIHLNFHLIFLET